MLDQLSWMVMCTRRRWLRAPRSACSEMPALAASEMMPTSLRPSWNACRSRRLTLSLVSPAPPARASRRKRVPGGNDGT